MKPPTTEELDIWERWAKGEYHLGPTPSAREMIGRLIASYRQLQPEQWVDCPGEHRVRGDTFRFTCLERLVE